MLETLILYFANEYLHSKDANIDLWILVGTIVQLAMHMGYHRDPRHFKGVSLFTAEMRRRIWATIVELDVGIAAQMGLPKLIKQWQADTEAPRNLLDSDFDKDTTELPPARPETENTPVLYRLAKARLMSSLGLIADFTADTRPTTYSEVVKIDARLNEARASIPDCLQWQSLSHCVMDPPHIIMQKVFLDCIYLTAKIVLHRKHLTLSGTNDQLNHSREACLNGALRLLGHQQMLEEETQPLCLLYQERWRISSLVNSYFLLASSVLCAYMWQNRGPKADQSPGNTTVLEDIRASLEKSYQIWMRSSSSSKEAQKAAGALSMVLGKSSGQKTPNLQNDQVPCQPHLDVPQDEMLVSAGNYQVPCQTRKMFWEIRRSFLLDRLLNFRCVAMVADNQISKVQYHGRSHLDFLLISLFPKHGMWNTTHL